MYALFEDTGKFLSGRILTQADASLQVELESGKRQKVKATNVMLTFSSPNPAVLLEQAQGLAQSIDLDFAWEVLGDDEFGFMDFAKDYFNEHAGLVEQAAALLGLHGAPQYFRRSGKGRYKRMPADILRQALAAIEKKKELELRIEGWAKQLIQHECPDTVARQLYKILFKPDKNAPEYKAVVQAAKTSGKPVLRLLQDAHAIESSFQFHWQRFLIENFPGGTGFPAFSVPQVPDLVHSDVRVFSIDDSATTEIDDAFSVQGLHSGRVRVGIHIAAPGLAIRPTDSIDEIAKTRMSTVYMPGHKITMLPEAVVRCFSLEEGKSCPSVSLYLTLDEKDLSVYSTETCIERVTVQANLRYDQLDTWATDTTLSATQWDIHQVPAALKGVAPENLAFLYRLAKHLKEDRIAVRGKPEMGNRPDFNIKLVGNEDREPTGNEVVSISVRERGAPLDVLVAEAMIFANSTWGKMLADMGVPGIYRSQTIGKGMKVRMGSKPLPHAGMGVNCYAWCTSPLRRYVDLINQWQLIACVQNGATAALVAPFKQKDAVLFGIIATFEEVYAAYNAVQRQLELYWTLRYLHQNDISEITAVVIKEGLARASTLPLVVNLAGGLACAPGQMVRLQLASVDDLSLVVSATVQEKLESGQYDASADTATEDDGDDLPSLPILAMDIDTETTSTLDESSTLDLSVGLVAADEPPTPAYP